jgi:hypothetical protein
MIASMNPRARSFATGSQQIDTDEQSSASRDPLELRLARGLLLLLALVLPFEAPLFRLGPLQITTVELVLYATLAVWGGALAAKVTRHMSTAFRRSATGAAVVRSALHAGVAALRDEPMTLAVLSWCVVTFASAMAAPSYRAAAFKFALRTSSGVLAYFATRGLASSAEVGRRVVLALVAGASLSAATAILDVLAPHSAAWGFFRLGNFAAFGLARASGVFAYPTIGAMYWEAVLPLLVVAPFLRKNGSHDVAGMRGAALALLGSALLVGAILASATRSGLAGAAAACAMLLGLVWRSGTWVRRAAAGVLALLVMSSLASSATSGSLLGQRLQWWHDEKWFRAEYQVDQAPLTVGVSEAFAVPVTVRNTGALPWSSAGDHQTRLAYHWEPLTGRTTLADFEGLRTELPADVPPGGVLDLIGNVRSPKTEGTYRLQWDLVEEGVTWFSEQGNAMPEQRVDVTLTASGASPSREPGVARPTIAPPPPRRSALWRAAFILWRERPLFGIGPDNFRRRYQGVLSPAPTGQPYTDTRLHANSLYFETLADLGLVGIAALALIAFALVRLLRRHHVTGSLAGLGCGVAAVTFFVHGGLDYFFEFTPTFGLFWVLLGLTAAREPWPSSLFGALRDSTQ